MPKCNEIYTNQKDEEEVFSSLILETLLVDSEEKIAVTADISKMLKERHQRDHFLQRPKEKIVEQEKDLLF